MKQQQKKWVIMIATGFCIFSVAAIVITYPLIFNLGSVTTGFGDELVIAWIQNWVIHALMTNPLALFEANLYYPYHNTLAFTETFTLTSILAIPIRLLTGEPISTVNFTFLSSLVFLGFSIFLLCFYLTRNFILSLFSGLLIIFSPAVLDYTVHLQVLSVECVPLAILCFLHFIKTRKSKFLTLSLLFFVLQVYNSIMPGYFILFSFAVIFIFNMLDNRKKTLQLLSLRNILLFISALAFLTPIGIAYYSVSTEFNYVRDIRDAVHLAFQPEDFLYPGNRTVLHDFLIDVFPTNRFSQNGEFKPGYLGVVFSLLVVLAVLYFFKNFRRNSIQIKSFFSIAILGFILSLGPVLHLARQTIHEPFLIPLPYALLYYIVPGFQGLRNAGRWNMLFMIAIVVVIALVLNKLLAKYSLRKQLIIYTVLFFGVIAELSPLMLYPISQTTSFPSVYSWLATTDLNTKIIELPIYNWNMNPFTGRELYREYYGTIHFRRTVNGYTGFSPPPWQKLVVDMTAHFPNAHTVKTLKELDIDYVIIHTDEYSACNKTNICGHQKTKNGKEIIDEIQKSQSFTFVKRFDDTYIFKIK